MLLEKLAVVSSTALVTLRNLVTVQSLIFAQWTNRVRFTVPLWCPRQGLSPWRALLYLDWNSCNCLCQTIKRELTMTVERTFFWTDSTSVLKYVANSHTDFSSPSQWRHVPSKLNPADDASRGRAWVSGVSGRKEERWKRKRERAEGEKRLTQMLLLEPSTPTQHDSIPSNQNHFWSLGCQLQVSKSLPKINLTLRSGRAPVLVLLQFRFFLKPLMRSCRILVMENLPFLRSYNMF